ncbi:MAG TPA: bifunctional UDP-N-acetylglucosamine diphosphorylase/glucosamine-1-phosphate N-acetyltransferase GlmU [Solirubrobacteraceae bacterium]|nr:bifunctional UDP-N-acetylglucosamine diphosphorylase/glucosamine-1-phosphate N-acetyltransferase GlmU [Solirubrobacteraceae bacterium]
MSASTVVILAAGRGTRMRSATPKLAHELCGRPLLAWPVEAAQAAGAGRVVVVVGPDDGLSGLLDGGVELAVQQEPLGTADAVAAAAGLIDGDDVVIVLAGDVPLVEAELLRELADHHRAADAVATMVTAVLADPAGYGRVVRGAANEFVRVVETKVAGDASADELAITEVNTGIYAFDGGALLEALEHVGTENAQGERYLPDVLEILRARGAPIATFAASDPAIVLGVNDRVGLAAVREEAQRRIQERHMLAGVTIVAPATTSIDVAVAIGEDTVIEPCTQLRGSTRIGRGATVGPHSTLIDALIGDGVSIVHSHLVRCEVREGASVGPFAYLRPDALLRERSKVGTFVEVKNSDIGVGSKVPHLSYVGDADIGESSNLGAGSITANYDGSSKHRTTIGARVHGGVDTAFVAPVTVGDDAWTAAGTVVTVDVPPGALAIARSRQRNVERYSERRGQP